MTVDTQVSHCHLGLMSGLPVITIMVSLLLFMLSTWSFQSLPLCMAPFVITMIHSIHLFRDFSLYLKYISVIIRYIFISAVFIFVLPLWFHFRSCTFYRFWFDYRMFKYLVSQIMSCSCPGIYTAFMSCVVLPRLWRKRISEVNKSCYIFLWMYNTML